MISCPECKESKTLILHPSSLISPFIGVGAPTTTPARKDVKKNLRKELKI
jgi:hypothetical protein